MITSPGRWSRDLATTAGHVRSVRTRYRGLANPAALLVRAGAGVIGLVIVSALANDYQQSAVATALTYGVAAMALTVLMGWAGRPSVMTAANLLVGGYVAAFAAGSLHLGFPLVLLLCLVAGAVFGALTSLPARRLGGIYLLLSTLAIYYIVADIGNLVQSNQGALAGYILEAPSLFGWTITSSTGWIWLSGIACICIFEYFRYLRRTRIGRAWIVIRDAEDAAGVTGVKRSSYILICFMITTAIQFLAGGLLAFQIGTVSYSSVSLQLSVSFIVMIVLGRMGSLAGAIGGALVVGAVPVFMDSLLGSSDSSGWLSQNLVPLESVVFALIGVAVLLALPRRVAFRVRVLWERRRSSGRGSSAHLLTPDAVQVSSVSVQYGAGEQAISGVTIAVSHGNVLALLGRNGAGKTSLLYSIGGFPPGAQGRVVGGHVVIRAGQATPVDITHASIIERNRLGVVLIPAEDKVFIDLSVRDHLREALAAGMRRRGDMGDASVSLTELLDRFPSLRTKLDRSAGNLSGGERQQLALAMALARSARILLVDEATLGLAPIAVRAVEPVLRELGSHPERSLVLAEQNPQLAMRVAANVALLDAGEIVRMGVPDARFLEVVERNYLGLPVEDGPASPLTASRPEPADVPQTGGDSNEVIRTATAEGQENAARSNS